MFVAKYRNFRFIFIGNIVMKKNNKLKNILKKSVKIGVMGTILVANVIIFVCCSNSNNDKDPTYGVSGK
jgi:hypothetical protein